MTSNVWKWGVLGVVGAVAVALLSIPLQAGGEHQGQGPEGHKAAKPACPGHKVHHQCAAKLDKALKLIDQAAAAVEKGQKKIALVNLNSAKALLADCRKAIAARANKQIVNAVCPMMGSPLDPKKVPENLTRIYKGKLVGFCCGSCPVAWDKLSDEDKAKKLRAASRPRRKGAGARGEAHGGHH